jgi:ABC-type Fe3+ transport system permease subunit
MKNILRFVTVLFIVLPLSSLLWDMFEMPAMFNLSKDNYQLLQGFTNSLTWLVIFEILGVFLTVVLIRVEKKKKRTYRNLLVALICFAVSIALFFIFVLPADITTENWTAMPDNWDALRGQWEYATSIRALISLTGLSFLVFALLQNRNYYRVYSQWSSTN